VITINHVNIDVTTFISKITIGLPEDKSCTLSIVLPNISYENRNYIETLVNSLDWSNAENGSDYHLESDVLTKTSASPGLTYKYDYVTNTWKDTRTKEEMWKDVRLDRDVLLKTSDWTQMPDVAIATKSAWATYRQQLRDITTQTDPFNITWPQPPGA
jgi:hypothetical protein